MDESVSRMKTSKHVTKWFLFPCYAAFFGWIQAIVSLAMIGLLIILVEISLGGVWGRINLSEECSRGLFPWSCKLAYGLYFMLGLVVCAFAYALTGIWFKCPHCSKRILLDMNNKHHPNAKKKFGMVGFASIILQTIFESQFTCSKCGEDCLVGDS